MVQNASLDLMPKLSGDGTAVRRLSSCILGLGRCQVNKLHTLHFVFTWILAIIVAVNWCYSFKLALPQYSESILPWSIYTLFVTLLMPGVRMVLLRMEKQEGWSKTGQICQDLLIKMTGPVVGTSWAGLVALVFPYFSDWKSPGPTGISLALAVTTGFILLQTAMERAMRDMSQQECRAVCFDILLYLVQDMLAPNPPLPNIAF